MKVLIVKLSSLGDVVHALPSLDCLRRGLTASAGPGETVEIDWLVEDIPAGILSGHPMIDELIVVKRRGWLTNTLANLKTAFRLRRKRYDIVLDFQGLLKSAIWVFLSGGKRRIGFENSREMSAVFLNEKLAAYDPDMHAVDRYLLLARHVSGCGGEVVFPVHIPRKAEEKAKRNEERRQRREEARRKRDEGRRIDMESRVKEMTKEEKISSEKVGKADMLISEGDALYDQGKYEEALKWHQKALSIDSKYADEYSQDSEIGKHIEICNSSSRNNG